MATQAPAPPVTENAEPIGLFREDKATQMAARFLKMAPNNRLPYPLLLRLMYVADKAMLLKFGFPITYDAWASMEDGPVLSKVYGIIKASDSPADSGCWERHIHACQTNDVELCRDPGDEDLSRAEDEIISQTFNEYGRQDNWMAQELTRMFPEWTRPTAAEFAPIEYSTVLEANGASQEVVSAVAQNIELATAIRYQAAYGDFD
jgi:hypothetical protein